MEAREKSRWNVSEGGRGLRLFRGRTEIYATLTNGAAVTGPRRIYPRDRGERSLVSFSPSGSFPGRPFGDRSRGFYLCFEVGVNFAARFTTGSNVSGGRKICSEERNSFCLHWKRRLCNGNSTLFYGGTENLSIRVAQHRTSG